MESAQTELNLYGLVFPDKETKLTELEKKVFDLIPLGKENAVTGSYIATTLKISKRHVIELVRRLRLKYCDIGSTTSNGYYRFKNPQEYEVGYISKEDKVIASNYLLDKALSNERATKSIKVKLAKIKERLEP